MSYSYNLKEREEIEKRLLHKILKNKKAKVFTLERGYNNRVLGFSPYRLNNDTNLVQSRFTSYKYGNLSRQIHNSSCCERYHIEKQIYELLPYKEQYIHLIYDRISKSYKEYVRFCNLYDIPLVKKQTYNTLCNLIKKWRIVSGNLHYKMTQSEKRKLKKIYKKSLTNKN